MDHRERNNLLYDVIFNSVFNYPHKGFLMQCLGNIVDNSGICITIDQICRLDEEITINIMDDEKRIGTDVVKETMESGRTGWFLTDEYCNSRDFDYSNDNCLMCLRYTAPAKELQDVWDCLEFDGAAIYRRDSDIVQCLIDCYKLYSL